MAAAFDLKLRAQKRKIVVGGVQTGDAMRSPLLQGQ
jgi:hypothetical protein